MISVEDDDMQDGNIALADKSLSNSDATETAEMVALVKAEESDEIQSENPPAEQSEEAMQSEKSEDKTICTQPNEPVSSSTLDNMNEPVIEVKTENGSLPDSKELEEKDTSPMHDSDIPMKSSSENVVSEAITVATPAETPAETPAMAAPTTTAAVTAAPITTVAVIDTASDLVS